MNREEAMAIVEEAGLIYQNDGHPDIWYVRIAERLEYIKRLEVDIADHVLALENCQEVEGFIEQYQPLAHRLWLAGKTWRCQGNIETEGAPFNLHALIGKPIPWRVDYGDDLPHEVFVGVNVEWDFDGNCTWALVNAARDRWLDYETATAWLEEEE